MFMFFELGSAAGPVIQVNGRLTFEDDLRLGGLLYTSMHSEPALVLSLRMVTLGKSGGGRCQEMVSLSVGYILQCKVSSASSSGKLDLIVCEVL